MRMPYLPQGGGISSVTESIGGLWLTGGYENGSLAGGLHLDSRESPALCQRAAPLTEGEYEDPQAMAASGGKLALICGGRVIWDGADIGRVTEGAKHTAVIGQRIVIFPDKKYIDTASGELCDMEASVTASGLTFDGGSIELAEGQWPFAEGDGVEISGCAEHKANDLSLIVRGVEGTRLRFDDNVFEAGTESGSVTVRRRLPDLEVICESGNRLWGCEGNVIYGSKLGDPLNFFVYDGLSTDSYAVTIGGDGGFTACAPYGSHIMFFKEDMAYKLYGTRPANFQLMPARIPGVSRGCAPTVLTDSEDMYYLGTDGFYAYSGGVPRLLSQRVGMPWSGEGCGGIWKGRYYLSGGWGTWTYDLLRERWLPWGEEQGAAMTSCGGRMHMLCRGGRLLALDEGAEDEEWLAEFRPFKGAPGRYTSLCGVIVDARQEDGAWMALEYRMTGRPWQRAAVWPAGYAGPRKASLPPNRGYDMTLRLRGRGQCTVMSIERIFRRGSEQK